MKNGHFRPLVAFLAVFLGSFLAAEAEPFFTGGFFESSFSSSDEERSLSAFLVALLAVLGTFLAAAGAPFFVLVVVFDVSFSSSDESLAFFALVTFLVGFVGELAFSKTGFLALLSSFFKLAPFFTGDDLSFGFGLFLAFLAFNDFSSSEESSLSAFLDFGGPFWPSH